jgi:RecJ-like exonuclease
MRCNGRGCAACGDDGGIEHWQVCDTCKGSGRINRSRQAVEVAERFADGEVTEEEMEAAEVFALDAASNSVDRTPAELAWNSARPYAAVLARNVAYFTVVPHATQATLLREIAGNPYRPVTLPKSELRCVRCGGKGTIARPDTPWSYGTLIDADQQTCGLCKGKGTVNCPSPWLTPQVLSLAQAAYEERPGRKCVVCYGSGREIHIGDLPPTNPRQCQVCHGTGHLEDGTLDPVRLAILADALEEAGCTDEAILRHLRGEEIILSPHMPRVGLWGHLRSPHVRGCWSLDVILGKE